MSNIQLKKFCNEIKDTCFIKVVSNENTGILYYKNGRMINACINYHYGNDNVEEILNWKDSEFKKVKIDSVTKFSSEDLRYILDLIEYCDINADVYIKQKNNFLIMSFSIGCLVSVIPEVSVTKDLLLDLLTVKGKLYKMKLTGEKTGDIKIFISELLAV